jgi:hypothetical protein
LQIGPHVVFRAPEKINSVELAPVGSWAQPRFRTPAIGFAEHQHAGHWRNRRPSGLEYLQPVIGPGMALHIAREHRDRRARRHESPAQRRQRQRHLIGQQADPGHPAWLWPRSSPGAPGAGHRDFPGTGRRREHPVDVPLRAETASGAAAGGTPPSPAHPRQVTGAP